MAAIKIKRAIIQNNFTAISAHIFDEHLTCGPLWSSLSVYTWDVMGIASKVPTMLNIIIKLSVHHHPPSFTVFVRITRSFYLVWHERKNHLITEWTQNMFGYKIKYAEGSELNLQAKEEFVVREWGEKIL